MQGTDYIWAAGDNAQVPDMVGRKAGNENAWCPPNAQHALRQAKVLGDNVISGMRGFPQKEYSHANKGAVAGLGLHKGVAMIVMGKMKIKLKGRLAWYMHRGYHGMAMPTWNRKIRVFADWTLGMFLKREVVSLGAMETPREEFYEAAKPAPAPAAARPTPTGQVRGREGQGLLTPYVTEGAVRHPWCGRPLRRARTPPCTMVNAGILPFRCPAGGMARVSCRVDAGVPRRGPEVSRPGSGVYVEI